MAKALRFQLTILQIDTGQDLVSFLASLGFEQIGNSGGVLTFEAPEPAQEESRGQAYQSGDSSYQLGKDSDLLLIRSEDEMRNVIETMAGPATHYLRILSPFLEHRPFDTKVMKDICSALARRNKRTRVEILVYESHRMVKNGHMLLELSQRLPSSISIKLVHPELRTLTSSRMSADSFTDRTVKFMRGRRTSTISPRPTCFFASFKVPRTAVYTMPT